MNDKQLCDVWATLSPSFLRRRRIDTRVSGWLDAHDTLLAAEWLELFRAAPFATLGLVTVSAVAIAATPFVWFASAWM